MLNKNLMPRPKRRQAEPAPPEQTFEVQGDHITLGQLLKVTGIISTGGEAKLYLADIAVLVNGEPEQRRGRKLRAGDRVAAPDAPPLRLVAPADAADLPDGQQTPDAMVSPRAKNKPGGDAGAGQTGNAPGAPPISDMQGEARP